MTLFKLPNPSNNDEEPEGLPSEKHQSCAHVAEANTKATKLVLDESHAAPARWSETYDSIREIRVNI